MPEFNYRGRDNQGQLVTGVRKAYDEVELAERLMDENITPVDIEPVTMSREQLIKKKFLARFDHVPMDELQMFCRQMYTLSKSGIPLIMGIQRLAESSKNKYFTEILVTLITKLNEGQTLASALVLYPKVFSPLFVNIVRVGENTGRLEEAFLQLSRYLQLEEETKKRVKAALRYPIIVVVATIIAILVINAFVIPTFTQLFSRFKGELPLMTKILIASSNFFTNYWLLLLIVSVGGFIALRTYIKTEKGHFNWDKWILKIPLVGWIIHRIMLARFARLFSLILESGISAFEGLDMVATSLGNVFLEDKVHQISRSVARGVSIAKAAAQTEMFSALIIQILTVGEETGQLESMLLDVAEFYEREVEYDIARLSEVLEPILMIIMAALVLVLALGVFLPMWDMIKMTR